MIGIIQSIMITAFLNYGLIDREEIEAYKFGIECYILKIIHFGTYILGSCFFHEPVLKFDIICYTYP